MARELVLNNGVKMPRLGLGVFQTPTEQTAEVVEVAIRTGYRLIDTAAVYYNEVGVGEGVRKSGVDRSEIFIETKVWISDYGYDETLHAFEKAVRKLGLDQLDLLLLHQPLPSCFDRTIESYKALERLLAEGRVRAIGVSNFMPEYLDRLLAETTIVPAVNQIEFHPYFQQTKAAAKNSELGIISQAWSPIGGIKVYREGERSVLEDPVILSIAESHRKTPAQVILGWHLQRGRSAVPKSVSPTRIAENIDVFDIQLSDYELSEVEGLNTNMRGGPEPTSFFLETNTRFVPEA